MRRAICHLPCQICLEVGMEHGLLMAMGSFSKNVALVALGFWMGCAILFVAVVAPTIFNADVASGLSRDMAASISSAILRRVYTITYIVVGIAAFFLLMASFADRGARGPRRALILCLLILGVNAFSHLWVVDKMNKIRVQMANVEQGSVPALKETFNKWHKASEVIYGTAVAFGLLASALLLPGGVAGKTGKSRK